MSTDFRIAGQGRRVSLRKWETIAKALGGSLPPHEDNNDSGRLLSIPEGYLWLYRNGKVSWNQFTRFGGNGRAANRVIDHLLDCGYIVYSEHDEGYWRAK